MPWSSIYARFQDHPGWLTWQLYVCLSLLLSRRFHGWYMWHSLLNKCIINRIKYSTCFIIQHWIILIKTLGHFSARKLMMHLYDFCVSVFDTCAFNWRSIYVKMLTLIFTWRPETIFIQLPSLQTESYEL
jgi:hypothetical protein